MENENDKYLLKLRVERNLSRIEAADLISDVCDDDKAFSPQKIQRLEAKKLEDIHPKDIAHISEGYSCPQLKYYYCSNVCPLGATMPQVNMDYDLPGAVMKLMLSLEDVRTQQRELMDIATDGKIDKKEKSSFLAIQSMLQEITDMYQTILYRFEEQERQENM